MATAAALVLAVASTGCATLRAPERPPATETLPLVAGVCPGPFNDYAGEGRHLLRALRERRLFREVIPLGGAPRPVDLVLVPHVGAPEPHPLTGALTLVPWVASATVLPWIVQSSEEVQVQVHPADSSGVTCARLVRPALTLSAGPRRRTRAMVGWTTPLLALTPRWEMGEVHEFRPAVDSLVSRRDALLDLARRR